MSDRLISAMERRAFLKLAGAGAGVVMSAGLLPRIGQARPGLGVFEHGIASGDPTSDSIILWTRVTQSPEALPGSGVGGPVDVEWQLASDPGFRAVERSGRTTTDAGRDHTVKVDVKGLEGDREYFYRFRVKNDISATGRARTSPGIGQELESLRFGVASCANYEGGHFGGYRHLADRGDLDFVLHLGDYIYEYGPGGYGPGAAIGRIHEPDHEIVSLADYRIRHAQYKRDPDLQACHAAHPFITAWDDHEVTNDTWREGAENHQPDEGDFLARRNRAYRAYFEWMPIRLPSPRQDPNRIYRRFRLGKLADLHMLDTRQYRDEQPDSQADPAIDDPARTITGDAQMRWLKDGLVEEGPLWRLVGNQLMVTPWQAARTVPINVDAWDGYEADRLELLTHIQEASVDNVVFLTGDIHTSWANEVPISPETYPVTPPVAVEIVGPSITSDNLDEIAGTPPRTSSVALETAIVANDPYVKFVELDSHGYCVVDADGERLHVDWFFLDDKNDPGSGQRFAAAYETSVGTSSVGPAEGPLMRDRR